MYSIIAGLGPLIGEGVCCLFVGAGREPEPITYARGAVSDRLTERITVEDPYTLSHPEAPVAVLTGPLTADSGEFAALALRNRPATRLFGQATFGVPIGREPMRLGGAVLVLTVRLGADRTGDAFDGPIPPDEVTPSDWTIFAGSDDATMVRAAEWIETQLDSPR
jgi:C-terminal processing protease CtpA/Prc